MIQRGMRLVGSAHGTRQSARGRGQSCEPRDSLVSSNNALLTLQGSAGNRAVGGLIQTKLLVGPVGDAHEQEADNVARAVVDGRSSFTAQRASSAGVATPAPTNVEQGIQRARGGGRPLPSDVRGPMEDTLGVDFTDVRLHTGPEATELNDQLSARAFTTGRDIFVRDGEFGTGTAAGRQLIAHELTHVVQQGAGRPMIRRFCGHEGCAIADCQNGEKCGANRGEVDEEEDFQVSATDLVEGAGEYVELPDAITTPIRAKSVIENTSSAVTSLVAAAKSPTFGSVMTAADNTLGALDSLGVPLAGTGQSLLGTGSSVVDARRAQTDMNEAEDRLNNESEYVEQGRAQPTEDTREQLVEARGRRQAAGREAGRRAMDAVASMVPFAPHVVAGGRLAFNPERRTQLATQAQEAATSTRNAVDSDYHGRATPLPLYGDQPEAPAGITGVISGGLTRAAAVGRDTVSSLWEQVQEAGSAVWSLMPAMPQRPRTEEDDDFDPPV